MSTSGAPAVGEHLGLGDGGALVLGDAGVEQHPGDLAGLVRLDVRPQPVRAAGHLDDAGDVPADQAGKNTSDGLNTAATSASV